MAMMDDKNFLIAHLRNSFITSDDMGMCEIIIELEDGIEKHPTGAERRPTTWPARASDSVGSDSGLDSDIELSHSCDILPDMDFAGHRRRSNTAQRLEKLRKEKHQQSKIKHIQWRDVAPDHSAVDEIGEYFEKKEIVSRPITTCSSLSDQLEKFAQVPHNPFLEYARFDGRAAGGQPTKQIGIFLTMLSSDERCYPMNVITLLTAKVSDLIGLICWQYKMEERSPQLSDNLDAFALHIAEDDGEVDPDFPALDSREPISKFGFHRLALVERDTPRTPPSSSVVVTINLPSRGFSKLSLESDSIPMKEILNKVLSRRKLRQRTGAGLEYRLERQQEPGVAVDLESPLSAMGTLEFFLVRENSVRDDPTSVELPQSLSEMAESLSSHQYKSFIVSLVHKIRTNTDVQLGISGEKIEIDPVSAKSLIFRQKAVTYDIYEDIAACTLIEEKSSGKGLLRLVYRDIKHHDFRHHDFECELQLSKEIVSKVNNILEMRSSRARKDYLAYREKKLQKRHTLAF